MGVISTLTTPPRQHFSQSGPPCDTGPATNPCAYICRAASFFDTAARPASSGSEAYMGYEKKEDRQGVVLGCGAKLSWWHNHRLSTILTRRGLQWVRHGLQSSFVGSTVVSRLADSVQKDKRGQNRLAGNPHKKKKGAAGYKCEEPGRTRVTKSSVKLQGASRSAIPTRAAGTLSGEKPGDCTGW